MTDERNNPWDSPSESSQNAQEGASADAGRDAAPTTSLPLAPTHPAQAGAAEDDGDLTPSETSGPYRPAPQYGAFGPTPTDDAAPTTTQPTQPIRYGLPYQDQNQHPQPTQPYGSAAPFGAPTSQPSAPSAQPLGAQQAAGGPTAPGGPDRQGPQANGPRDPYAGLTGQSAQPRTASNVVVAVVAAVVTAAICLGLGYAALTNGWVSVPASGSLSSLTNKGGSGSAVIDGGEAADWPAVADHVSPSVVSIQTETSDGTAKGSGAILDADGHIITNNHVISGAKTIVVTLDNGDIYEAKLVGTDTTTDLAVIKIDNPPSDLTPVTFADSDNLAAGEAVMAIGNPLGYDGTVTTGIVSALDRPVTVMDEDNTAIVTNAVQIDAAINPGNSGGPTFNAAGQVIGINSSIASTATSSESAGSIGIGFAIPSNLAKRVSEEIIKNGKVQHVALGVTIQSDTVQADGVTRGGALVKSVVDGGPAAQAGVKTGDTIVGFDGHAVNNNYSLLGFVRAAALGSTVKLTIVRDGRTMELDVKLDKAEEAVNGTNRQESDGQNGDGQNGDGQNGDGQNDGQRRDQDNGGGLLDPFGLW